MLRKLIAVADRPWLRHLIDRVEQQWSRLRDITYGLWIARVSAASVIIGAVLFYYARPAQDLFLEVGDTPLASLGYWGLFYLIVLLFWVFPVYLSARWILARVDVIRLRRPGLPAVEDRVRRTVPAVLAAGCLVAVLIGQVLAVSNAPILTNKGLDADKYEIINERIRTACPKHEGDPAMVIGEILDGTCRASLTLFISAWKGIRQWATLVSKSDHAILLVYAICAAVLFWMLLRQRSIAVSQKNRWSKEAILWWVVSAGLIVPTILLFWTAVLVALLWIVLASSLKSYLFTDSNFLILLFSLLVVSIVLGTLSWWRRAERVLWWAFTIAIVTPISLLTFLFATGFIASELEQPYGLWHLAVLLPVSAVIGMLVWWGLSPGPNGKATRVGHFIMWLLGRKGPIDDAIATARLVRPLFVTLALTAVGLLIVVFVLVLLVPVAAVGAFPLFSRSLLIPLILGMLVPPVTVLSCWSLRARAPLVLGAIVLIAVGSPLVFNPQKIGVVPTQARLGTLDESLKQWAKANKCELNASDGSALTCPAPLIVAAAGGASRAAFQVVGLMGMLMDGTRPPVVLSTPAAAVYETGFSPDNRRIWTRSSDSIARLWHGETGARIAELRHEGSVRSVGVSLDGRRVVTGSSDKTARIWDSESGSPIATLENSVFAIFGPDGRRILTHSDKGVRLWDGEKGTPIGSPMVHGDIVSVAIFSPDGRRIFTSSRDKTARLWDGESGAEIGQPREHDGAPRGQIFSPDNRWFLTRSGKTAQLWDARTGTKIGRPLDRGGSVRDAVFSLNGSRLVTRTGGSDAWLWDAERGTLISPLKHEGGNVDGVVFSPNNRRIVTRAGRTVHLWDAENGVEVFRPAPYGGKVTDVVFTPTGHRIVISSAANNARLLDGETGRQLGVLDHDGAVHAAVVSGDGRRILTRSADRTARLWDSDKGDPIHVLKHEGGVTHALFSPNGLRIVTQARDKTVRLWDGNTGAEILLGPEREPGSFGRQVFAISGVSGGALGAATFYAALADSQLRRQGGPATPTGLPPPCKANARVDELFMSSDKDRPKRPGEYWKDCLQLLLAGDFLSPVFLSMIGGDLLGVQPRDRTFVLEKSWEARYLAMTRDPMAAGAPLADSTLARPMLSIRDDVLKADPKGWLPILFLNGTSVQSGRRIIASDVDTTRLFHDDDLREGINGRLFRDTDDLRERIHGPGNNESEGEKRQSWDIPLSTAVTISARFPGISPHGDIVMQSRQTVVDRVVDGGYYEAFGASTALELVEALERLKKDKKYNLKPFVILINNEPGMPDLDCEDAKRKPAARPNPDAWAMFATWRSPFDAVLGTRRARGMHAAAQLCDYVKPSRFAFVTVGQQIGFTKKELSMSWWLSKYVQRYLDGELIRTNGESLERIMAVR